MIELKLVLEADQQQLLVARNQVLPQLNAVALYQWNGLDGRTPEGAFVSTTSAFPNWQIGVNFSVPLGLRGPRAKLRQQELLIQRDRANLDEQLLDVSHLLSAAYRSVAGDFEQFRAYRRAKQAALENYQQQAAEYESNRRKLFVNLLQAITQWGTVASSEAQALTQYNTDLAFLEQQTGTILQTHGVRFAEERYGSLGPFLGRPCYPLDTRPGPNQDHYPNSAEPSEKVFGLDTRNLTGGAPRPEGEPENPLRPGAPESIPAPSPIDRK